MLSPDEVRDYLGSLQSRRDRARLPIPTAIENLKFSEALPRLSQMRFSAPGFSDAEAIQNSWRSRSGVSPNLRTGSLRDRHR